MYFYETVRLFQDVPDGVRPESSDRMVPGSEKEESLT